LNLFCSICFHCQAKYSTAFLKVVTFHYVFLACFFLWAPFSFMLIVRVKLIHTVVNHRCHQSYQ
jgi:hypothetical protein